MCGLNLRIAPITGKGARVESTNPFPFWLSNLGRRRSLNVFRCLDVGNISSWSVIFGFEFSWGTLELRRFRRHFGSSVLFA